MRSIKICLISSHGGHLRELLDATAAVKGDRYFVTHKTAHTAEILKDEKHYFILDPHLSWFKYAVNFCQSLKHVLQERPELVITSGAGIAIPSVLLCRFLFKAKIIFIELSANVINPSRTGKFLYRFADLFLIQWPSLQSHYPKAVHCGLIL
jgi:beta-1,4-N-acetylglucosaminyltransferase